MFFKPKILLTAEEEAEIALKRAREDLERQIIDIQNQRTDLLAKQNELRAKLEGI
jgi:hypothetical protein